MHHTIIKSVIVMLAIFLSACASNKTDGLYGGEGSVNSQKEQNQPVSGTGSEKKSTGSSSNDGYDEYRY